jgi:malonate decarboxylase gamma subunit
VVSETVAEDASKSVKRPIVAVIDVPSQAYGRREEAFGIHQALAGRPPRMPTRAWPVIR